MSSIYGKAKEPEKNNNDEIIGEKAIKGRNQKY